MDKLLERLDDRYGLYHGVCDDRVSPAKARVINRYLTEHTNG